MAMRGDGKGGLVILPNRMSLPSSSSPRGRSKGGANRNNRFAGVKSNYIPYISPTLSQAYKEFNASLTPAQRKALNLHTPANPTGEIKPLYKEDECVNLDNLDDPQDLGRNQWLSPLAAADHAITPQQEEAAPSGFVHIIAVLAILRRALRVYEVSSQQDHAVRLHGDCIAIALGIPGFRVAEVARTHLVTKQAVSKRVKVIAAALELPPAYRTPLAALPTEAGMSLKGKPHPHPSKPRTSQAKGQQCHNPGKPPHPLPKRASNPKA